jgi:hypothetical protein
MPFILETRSGVKSSSSPSAFSALTSWVSSPPRVPEVYIPMSLFSGSSAFSSLFVWSLCRFRRLYNLFEAIQTHGGPGTRAAVFFAAFSFFLSQISVNVVACGVVGGMDLAALLPRYLDIRRGSLLVAVIGIAINPWKILNVRSFTFPEKSELIQLIDCQFIHHGHFSVCGLPGPTHGYHGVGISARYDACKTDPKQSRVLSHSPPMRQALPSIHAKC